MSPLWTVVASIALGSIAGIASVPVASASPAGGIKQPPPPETGPGSLALPFGSVREEVFTNPARPDKRVYVFAPVGKDLPAKVPVVLFLHGFGATDPDPYRLWLEHMARRGCLVIFPVYAAMEAPGGLSRYDTMWSGFEEGIRRWAAGSPAPDVERLGVVGHSFGGGAAPAMAARAAVRGYGSKGLFVECWAPWYDLDKDAWTAIPAHAKLLVGAFEGDVVCDPAMAEKFPGHAVNVPAENKAFRLLRSDDHGAPALQANHLTPLCERNADALDTRGIWRLDDMTYALAFATADAAAKSPFASDAAALALGTWSDGTPIEPCCCAIPADPPGQSRRPRSSWREGLVEKGMRRVLESEAHSALPLPSPSVVPTSKLLRSERLVAEPPASIPATAPDQPTVFLAPGAALPAATLGAWKAAGIAVVDVKAQSDFAEKLVRAGQPTAMLLGRDRTPRLWVRADDPNLGAAVLELVATR